MKVKELVLNPAKTDELLIELNRVSVAHDRYEYGLPLYNDQCMAILREVVLKWLSQAEDA